MHQCTTTEQKNICMSYQTKNQTNASVFIVLKDSLLNKCPQYARSAIQSARFSVGWNSWIFTAGAWLLLLWNNGLIHWLDTKFVKGQFLLLSNFIVDRIVRGVLSRSHWHSLWSYMNHMWNFAVYFQEHLLAQNEWS